MTLNAASCSGGVDAWSARSAAASLLALFLLDTGCRISEALGVNLSDVDLDNMLVTLSGKGRKERIIPFNTATADAIRAYRSCAT